MAVRRRCAHPPDAPVGGIPTAVNAIAVALFPTVKTSRARAVRLRGVSARSTARVDRSGTQRHRIENTLQIGEPEGLVEERRRAFPLPPAGVKLPARQGDR